MKTRIDSRIYESDEARHDLLRETAAILSDRADAFATSYCPYDSTSLSESEYEVANYAQEYLYYYFAKENMS